MDRRSAESLGDRSLSEEDAASTTDPVELVQSQSQSQSQFQSQSQAQARAQARAGRKAEVGATSRCSAKSTGKG